jgi:hypothetical protein
MARSIRVTTKKKRGRPRTTGKGTQVGERWHQSELAQIDAWITATAPMTRGQAIRRLVGIGLAGGKTATDKLDQRLVKKASKAIDAMAADLGSARTKAKRG